MNRMVEICGTGIGLPARVVTSPEIDRTQGYPEGHTERVSGVVSRYYASTETASELAVLAAREALARAGLEPDAVDCIIAASGTMEQAIPCNAAHIHARLGLSRPIPAFDVNMTCLSALLAIDMAASMLAGGVYRTILICSSDIASVGVRWDDIAVGGMFGDGAAALVLSAGGGIGGGIRASRFETHSEGVEYCQIRGGGSRCHPTRIAGDYAAYGLFEMQGKELFKLTAQVIEPFLARLLADADLKLAEIDWIVPHQASKLGIQHIQKRLGFDEAKMINIFAHRGNQVAASLPSALHELLASGRTKEGDRVLLIGTSAGLSLGAMILEL